MAELYDLARFRLAILGGGGNFTKRFSGLRGPNFTKLISEDIGRSSLSCSFVSEFGYLAAFSNTGDSSSLSGVENDAKFRTF